MGSGSYEDEFAPYPGDDDGADWDFADVPGSFYIDVYGNPRRDFDDICALCHSVDVALPEDVSGSSSWLCIIHILSQKPDCVGVVKAVALDHLYVFEETAAAVVTS